MSLFVKQDFTPPLLSRKWIAIKCRPNMQLHSRSHVISILESGLMFREDSARVEQESPAADELWVVAGGGRTGWMTRGERILSVIAVGAALVAFPPKFGIFNRGMLLRVTAYAALPLSIRMTHRFITKGTTINSLLEYMRDYLTLTRRTMACVKEYRLLHKGLGSIAMMLEAATRLLFRQQTDLSLLMARSSSALLGNFPWLYEDVDWEALWKVNESAELPTESDLVKVHHAFLVIQSTLLKHTAMAHFLQTQHTNRKYANHNERIYWLHTNLLDNLKEEFKVNFEALDRMYRLLRNYGTNDTNFPKKSTKINNSWLYSDVHSSIARANIELKVALNKCTNLDVFLDSCASSKQDFDVEVLNKDLDELIDGISNCLDTVQKSQIKLKKLQNKFNEKKEKVASKEEMQSDVEEDTREVVRIGEFDIEPKDEVFFFVKTEDDDLKEQTGDIVTAPGKKEKEASKVVLKELKRKLVKREDLMRERERKALGECMPELKDNLPEFPRQIQCDDVFDRNGFIAKIRVVKRSHIYKQRKIRHHRLKEEHRVLKNKILKQPLHRLYSDLSELYIFCDIFGNIRNRKPSMVISVDIENKKIRLIICHKIVKSDINNDLTGVSEGLSDVEGSAINKSVNEIVNNMHKSNGINKNDENNLKCSKKDLDFTPSSSDDDQRENHYVLQDVRRNRVARRKNFPTKRGILTVENDADESLKPMEYSFGTGMAMASMLQVNRLGNKSLAQEEVFIGDGEVSEDSGNDFDA